MVFGWLWNAATTTGISPAASSSQEKKVPVETAAAEVAAPSKSASSDVPSKKRASASSDAAAGPAKKKVAKKSAPKAEGVAPTPKSVLPHAKLPRTQNPLPSPKAEAKFEDMFSRLEAYKAEHGDCNVPQKHDDRELSSFVFGLRAKMVRLKKGHPVRMSQEQIGRLDDLGFQWVLTRGRPRKND